MPYIPKSEAGLADAYGRLKAEQAKLAKHERELKAAMLELRPEGGAVEGRLFRVTISRLAGSMVPDMAAIRRLLRDLPMKQTAPSDRFAAKAKVAAAEQEAA